MVWRHGAEKCVCFFFVFFTKFFTILGKMIPNKDILRGEFFYYQTRNKEV
jgi:hypothetical protein